MWDVASGQSDSFFKIEYEWELKKKGEVKSAILI